MCLRHPVQNLYNSIIKQYNALLVSSKSSISHFCQYAHLPSWTANTTCSDIFQRSFQSSKLKFVGLFSLNHGQRDLQALAFSFEEKIFRYDSIHWKCYTPEIHQMEKVKFLGTNANSNDISIWICTTRYWESEYLDLVDFGVVSFSVAPVMMSLQVWGGYD